LTTAPTITTIYAKFGIPESATTEQIVQAYLRLATKLYPAVQAHDEKATAQFQSLANAYFVLSDATEKRRYDQYIAAAPSENFKLSQRPPAADTLFEHAATQRTEQLSKQYINDAELAGALMEEGVPEALARSLAHSKAAPDLGDFGLDLAPVAQRPLEPTAAPAPLPQQDMRSWQLPPQQSNAQSTAQAGSFQPYAPPQSITRETNFAAGEMVYAGFWERYAAYMLDGIIVGIGGLFVAGLFIGLFRSPGLGQLINIAIGVAYFTLQESSAKRATLGKRAIGLQVATTDGGQLSPGRALGRYFARWISAAILLIGYLMQPFTKKRQALHDMITDTVVVRDPTRKSSSVLVVVAVLSVPVLVAVIGILAAIAIPQYAAYQNKARIKAGQLDGRTALVMLVADHDGSHPYPAHRSFQHSPGVESVEFDANEQAVVVTFVAQALKKTPMYVYTIKDGAQTCYMMEGQTAKDINTCPSNAPSDLHD